LLSVTIQMLPAPAAIEPSVLPIGRAMVAAIAVRYPQAAESGGQTRARSLADLNRRGHRIALGAQSGDVVFRLVRDPDILVNGDPVGRSRYRKDRLGLEALDRHLHAWRAHTGFGFTRCLHDRQAEPEDDDTLHHVIRA
jgi:hypothetical protein